MNIESFGSSPQLQAMQFRSRTPIVPAAAGARGHAGEVAANFEEVFQRMILKEMLPKDGGAFFGRAEGAEVFKDFFVGAVAKPMAARGALGIKDVVEAELICGQGHAYNEAAQTLAINLQEKEGDDEPNAQK